MDDELLELQKQFEYAQQAKSSIRLSERNVVELVQKLHELHIIDFDLLHTVSGKEYITPEQLRHEIMTEIKKVGRVSLIDLADITGVDLYHVEKQAEQVVSGDPGLMLIQGEIISQSYWDSVAEEINERLQECSQLALAELAAQLQISSELVTSVLEPRLGTMVKGRLEGGQLYTPAYVARVGAMVRGAARGITVPINLSALWSTLQKLLLEMDGATGVAVEGSFFQSLFNGLVKEGEVLGSVRAGAHWTPTVFAIAQRECIDSFFSQNSFISYDALHKLGISQPVQFLQSRYPEGKHLVTVFVHPSMIEILDAATEDAVERGSWIDSLSVLPASFGSQDASKILSLCPSVQSALKANKALILGESYVFSNGFVKDVYDRVEKEVESFGLSGSSGIMPSDDSYLIKEAKVGQDTNRSSEASETSSESGHKNVLEKGSKKKRGKSGGNVKSGATESGADDTEYIPTKSKKNQKRGKDTPPSQVSDSKPGAKKDGGKLQEGNLNVPSEEWVIQKIMMLNPDFEEQGIDDPKTILRPLASYMRPMLINYLKEKRKALFTENAEKMKRLLDNLQKKLDESFLNMQLYEKALDLFEDDQSTSVIMHRHLLRATAATLVDTLFLNLAKSFPGPLSKRALAVIEALEGKQVETFMSAFKELAEESGLHLKKLDKKLERTLLHSYRKVGLPVYGDTEIWDLTSQVSAETDPVSLLAKVVSLLYVQVHNKALQAPGRAISVAVSRLKDKMDDSAYKVLTDYQTATVTLLALMSAATGDEQDCSSDRILSKREHLENLMPALKGLVLGSSQS
ncbi:E3 UFM1-protein ligase 1-like [Citrus sinensis]|uniref:E3 UFM1-protein ligase 1-like n=1 Tax=Citrus sinensis TaxID=2711 RepID=A0ACB8IXN3_CITSI|nr:E3 UFM1-protein ligase 1-like [Citrus sinensis]